MTKSDGEMMFKEKQRLLDNIAYNFLFHRGITNPCEDLIKTQMARLDRIIADLYAHEKDDIEYNKFAVDFLNSNLNEIVFTSKYAGDVTIPDHVTDTNVNVLINSMVRRGEAFPQK